MTKTELIKHLNALRKSNNGGLLSSASVASYKAYKTWVQYLTIDGLKHSSLCDCKPTQFLDFLNEAL
jgi:hypothetical protein